MASQRKALNLLGIHPRIFSCLWPTRCFLCPSFFPDRSTLPGQRQKIHFSRVGPLLPAYGESQRRRKHHGHRPGRYASLSIQSDGKGIYNCSRKGQNIKASSVRCGRFRIQGFRKGGRRQHSKSRCVDKSPGCEGGYAGAGRTLRYTTGDNTHGAQL